MKFRFIVMLIGLSYVACLASGYFFGKHSTETKRPTVKMTSYSISASGVADVQIDGEKYVGSDASRGMAVGMQQSFEIEDAPEVKDSVTIVCDKGATICLKFQAAR